MKIKCKNWSKKCRKNADMCVCSANGTCDNYETPFSNFRVEYPVLSINGNSSITFHCTTCDKTVTFLHLDLEYLMKKIIKEEEK